MVSVEFDKSPQVVNGHAEAKHQLLMVHISEASNKPDIRKNSFFAFAYNSLDVPILSVFSIPSSESC